ncbi:hypothetical protein [Nitrobacter sp. TKz-YC01]|uniref:hypothetical protein n=1 Tax=Nitrobacter sp. TKz-YC01 TaxID=3398703 RepID=UPI003A102A53
MSEPSEKLPASDKKRKIGGSGSETPHEDPRNNSVYDFLYHDARRIAAFLAQFETYGVLQGVKSHESVGRSSSSRSTASAGVDVVTLAKGAVSYDGTISDDERDAAERTYDPLWTNAKALLDYLTERSLIIRNLSDARIGQFVLVTGSFAAFDVGILREAWKQPAIKKIILDAATKPEASTNRHERRKNNSQHPKETSDAQAALELIPLLPHSVQGTIRSANDSIWFNLREESMVISSPELLLKHGIGVAGDWSAIGILDAMPEGDAFSVEVHAIEQTLAAASLGGIMSQMNQLALMTRLMLGRPPSTYGMTPLIIFREISGDAG